MSIKKTGGIFGRNPTFNDVDVDGTLTVGGNAVPDASTILVDGDIGSTVQAYDANTTKNDVANTFTATQTFDGDVYFTDGASSNKFFWDASLQRLAIGHAAPTVMVDIEGTAPTIRLTDSDATGTPECQIDGSGGDLRIYADRDNEKSGSLIQFFVDGSEAASFTSSGNLAFPSGQGIDFSATSGTGTSELFSDYEEGTWTAVIGGSTTAGTYETINNACTYTKIGNRVFLQARIRLAGTLTGGEIGRAHV